MSGTVMSSPELPSTVGVEASISSVKAWSVVSLTPSAGVTSALMRCTTPAAAATVSIRAAAMAMTTPLRRVRWVFLLFSMVF